MLNVSVSLTEDPPPTRTRSLDAQLDEWVSAGLVSPEQAAAIRHHEAVPAAGPAAGPPARAGTSLVVEALGYLGGVIMLVGAVLLVNLYWADLPTAVRLLLMGATAVALVLAGLAVPDRLGEAAMRLRSVLWALAVAATTTFMVVLSGDVLGRQDEASQIVVGPCTAVVAGVLWWFRRTWLQQVALLVPLVLSATGLAYLVGGLDTEWYGGFTWILAVVWSLLAYAGRLEPRVTGVGLGGLVAAFSALTIGTDLGLALSLVTAAALVAVALWERSLPWLAVAALAVLETAPRAAVQWFPGRLSASLTLIVTGGLLVAAATWVARHQGARQAGRRGAGHRPGRQHEDAAGGRPEGRPPAAQH